MVTSFINNGVDPVFSDCIGKHWAYKVPENYIPTDHQHQIIIASMIGDGSLSVPYKGASARICWNMGNKEHALFKRDAFDFVGAEYTQQENPGFGSEWHCVRTKSHPLFTRYGDKYGYTKSRVNPESGIYHELNEVGWAWLYGDDGHMCKNGLLYIHTESFSKDHAIIVVDALNKFIGRNCCAVHSYIGGAKKREMHCVRINKNASKEFISRIKENMANGLEYKTVFNS